MLYKCFIIALFVQSENIAYMFTRFMTGLEILVYVSSYGKDLSAAYVTVGCKVESYRGIAVDKTVAENVAVHV